MGKKLQCGDARAPAARMNNCPNGDVGAWCWTYVISPLGELVPSDSFEQPFQVVLPLP